MNAPKSILTILSLTCPILLVQLVFFQPNKTRFEPIIMPFNSFNFPLIFALYWLIPAKYNLSRVFNGFFANDKRDYELRKEQVTLSICEIRGK